MYFEEQLLLYLCSKVQRFSRKHYYWYRLIENFFMGAYAIELYYAMVLRQIQLSWFGIFYLCLYKYIYLSTSAFYFIYNLKNIGFTSNSSLRCPDAKARNASLISREGISIRLSVSIYWLKIKEWLTSSTQSVEINWLQTRKNVIYLKKDTVHKKIKSLSPSSIVEIRLKWLIFFVVYSKIRLMVLNKMGYYLQ